MTVHDISPGDRRTDSGALVIGLRFYSLGTETSRKRDPILQKMKQQPFYLTKPQIPYSFFILVYAARYYSIQHGICWKSVSTYAISVT